jgi:hypothetical protein
MSKQMARRLALAVAVGLACAASIAQQTLVAPGPNKVAFPENWSKGVMYATVDRPDTKQYRASSTPRPTSSPRPRTASRFPTARWWCWQRTWRRSMAPACR